MTSASAPGKIILFGEHAVVYGRPALAVPVTQVHADVEVLDLSKDGIWIDAPDINLHTELKSLPSDHPLAAVINNSLSAFGVDPFPSLNVKVASTIPVASGFGSGAAVSVALIRALSSHLDYLMTNEQVNALAYEIEKIHYGTPSGIDNTVITYAKPVFFVKGQPIETFRVGKPFTIVIGNTGVSAPTKEAVGDVRALWEADKARWEKIFDKVGEIAKKAKEKIENGEWELIGDLMNQKSCIVAGDQYIIAGIGSTRQCGVQGRRVARELSGGGRAAHDRAGQS